jgi:hypothetical protein
MISKFLGRLGVAALFGVMAFAAAPASAQSEQDFTLLNGTEYVIDEVYVAPSTSKTWGSDIMGDGVLGAGSSKLVKFRSGTSNCIYNMRVKWADGSSSEWSTDFDLCTISKITLRYNKSTDVTTAVTE